MVFYFLFARWSVKVMFTVMGPYRLVDKVRINIS